MKKSALQAFADAAAKSIKTEEEVLLALDQFAE
jgi:hypothetical protein